MSRSSTDMLAIGLGTGDIAIGTRSPAWTRWPVFERASRMLHRAGQGAEAPSAATDDAPDVGKPVAPHRLIEIEPSRRYTEEGICETLGHALSETANNARVARRATVVLDDFWGYHAIMQGDFRALRPKEVDEVAAAYFADTFGVDGAALSIRCQVLPGGRSVFASALPNSLVDSVQACGEAARLDIASLTLALPQMLNRTRSAVAGQSGWLLVVTATLLHAVRIGKRGWSAYDCERLFYDDVSDAAGVADAAKQIFERSTPTGESTNAVYLCGIALDPAPFEQSFEHVRPLREHMSTAAPALSLMELAS